MQNCLSHLANQYQFKRQILYSKDPGDYVLICKNGFLCDDSGRVGVYGQFKTKRRATLEHAKLANLGTINRQQVGDREFYVVMDKSYLDRVLELFKPRKRRITYIPRNS